VILIVILQILECDSVEVCFDISLIDYIRE
jgi:hypothetical protein